MLNQFDLAALKQVPEIAFYFRYPLHHADFHELRTTGENPRLLGHVTATPLSGELTDEGKMNRTVGYNGDIAIIFVKHPPDSVQCARLCFTHIAPDHITGPDGKHNWKAIRT